MKNIGLLISTLILFLLVNTSYFWERKLGGYAFPFFLFLALIFFLLTVLLVREVSRVQEEQFKCHNRIILLVIACALVLIILKPSGIINYKFCEKKDILIAQREGAANCTTTLKLKKDFTFSENRICFGISETTGTFIFQNDTIFFNNVSKSRTDEEFYDFAVITRDRTQNMQKRLLMIHQNNSDTIGKFLIITKNELSKLNLVNGQNETSSK